MCMERHCLMPAEYFSAKFHKLLDFIKCAFSGKHTVKSSIVHILWYIVNILLAFLVRSKGKNRQLIA